ncbi:hypothetical protein AA0116_g8426 [Alternaria tenuissima]|nr:hypothetical protein AA0116_g8426 [Alternaria tenuissima]
MNLPTSSMAFIEYLDELDELPERGKKERRDKRKRMVEALDYFHNSEMCRFRLDVLNDHDKCEALGKHGRKVNIEEIACCADLTAMFLSYLDNFGSPRFSEATTLDAIEEANLEITPFFPATIVSWDDIHLFPVAVAAWIRYRRAILSVYITHTTALLLSQILSPFTIKIKNSCLITQLRKAHHDYLATKTRDFPVYEILVDGFVALYEKSERRKIEMRIREGLESLERYLIGLGDELGEGAGRWIVSQQTLNKRCE